MLNEDIENTGSEEVETFYREVFRKILPNASHSSAAWFGSKENYEAWHSPFNFLKDSIYEYKGNHDFIHFTTPIGLASILHSGFLRMSEFGNLQDRQEIIYASQVFDGIPEIDLKKEVLDSSKKLVFCLSMSEYNENTLTNPFMWEAYSLKGHGACIRYRLTKPNPRQFLIGKLQYGQGELKIIQELKDHVLTYLKRGKSLPRNFTNLLLALFSFHKAERFRIENEVRMFLNLDDMVGPNLKLETLYQDVNGSNQVKYFNKLFLKNRHELEKLCKKANIPFSAILDIFPQIEITEIILGFSNSIESLHDKVKFLNALKKKYKYEFSIKYLSPELEIIDL
jgi:hypothetical protein